jgi:hypothetical protein
VQSTSSKSIFRIKLIVDFTIALILKLYAIPYNLEARTLLVTLLHLIEL